MKNIQTKNQGSEINGQDDADSRQNCQPTQLSLSLPNRPSSAKCASYMRARQKRIRRAGLWFNHMRQVVDRAPDRAESMTSYK